jgi:protein disulfide-isomerase A6
MVYMKIFSSAILLLATNMV